MGFDLYGITPSGVDIQQPKEEAPDGEWKRYFQTINRIDGAYYRSNVWGWRPLWGFIVENCDEILTEKDSNEGMYNDGHEISSEKANAIAKRLIKMIEDGTAEQYVQAFDEMKNNTPLETCETCDGTGTRKGWEGWQSEKEWLRHHDRLEPPEKPEMQISDFLKSNLKIEVGFKWAKKCKGCNACHGTGKVNAFFCHYNISIDDIRRFLKFCKHSGGFHIW